MGEHCLVWGQMATLFSLSYILKTNVTLKLNLLTSECSPHKRIKKNQINHSSVFNLKMQCPAQCTFPGNGQS